MTRIIGIMLILSLDALCLDYLNETELGQTASGGNSETLSINLQQKSTFIVGNEKYILKGSYVYAKSGEVLIVRNWSASTRIDHTTQKKLDLFLGVDVNGNKFTGFKERFDIDLGAKHYFTKPIDNEDKNLFYIELGLRYSKENRVVHDSGFNDEIVQGRLFIEYQNQINKSFYMDYTLENIGNLEHPGRYKGIFTASLNSYMTKFLTLKLTYGASYDDYLSSQNLKQLDYTYTTSILASF
jgi:hypothetical protein